MRNVQRTFLILLAMGLVTGCTSVQQFAAKVGTSVSGLFDSSDVKAPGSGDCPEIRSIGELGSISQFADPGNPNEQGRISWIEITNVARSCVYDQNNIAVQLDITMDGSLGPKAKTTPADRPSFAYPYFVAVATSDGGIVAKEVFTANVNYGLSENTLTQVETINQNLPALYDENGKPYSILIGFQLSEAELAYNRGQLWQPR